MARMTAQQHIDSMRHAIPRAADPRHDFWQTFNQAGRAVISCAQRDPWWHTWSWTTEATLSVPIAAGSEYLEIPELGQLVRGEFTGSTVDRVVLTTAAQIANYRANSTSRPNLLYVAADVCGMKHSSDVGPVPRVAIWPPQETARDDLVLTLQRRWVDVDSTDPTAVPNVPDDYERLLDLTARAFAVQKETQRPAFESAELIDEIDRLVGLDSGLQVEQGQPMHSVRRGASGRSARWFTRVTKP